MHLLESEKYTDSIMHGATMKVKYVCLYCACACACERARVCVYVCVCVCVGGVLREVFVVLQYSLFHCSTNIDKNSWLLIR